MARQVDLSTCLLLLLCLAHVDEQDPAGLLFLRNLQAALERLLKLLNVDLCRLDPLLQPHIVFLDLK